MKYSFTKISLSFIFNPETPIRKKWKYLRDNFCLEYGKREKQSANDSESGNDGESSAPIKWQYYKQLMFLKDVINPRNHSAPTVSLKSLLKLQSTEADSDYSEQQSFNFIIETPQGYHRHKGGNQMSSNSTNSRRIIDNASSCADNFDDTLELEKEIRTKSPHREIHRSATREGTHLRSLKRKSTTQDYYGDSIQRLLECEEHKLKYLANKLKHSSEHGDDSDLMFFKTLLPHVKMIPQRKKLQFQSRIQAVVEEFAYPTQLGELILEVEEEPPS